MTVWRCHLLEVWYAERQCSQVSGPWWSDVAICPEAWVAGKSADQHADRCRGQGVRCEVAGEQASAPASWASALVLPALSRGQVP